MFIFSNVFQLGVSFNNSRYTPVSKRIVDGGLKTAQQNFGCNS